MNNQTFAAYRHLPTDAIHILDLALFQKQTMPDGATSLACEYINEDGEKVFAVIASGEQDEPGVTYVPLSEDEGALIMDIYVVSEWPQATHGKYENLPNGSEYLFKIDPELPEHVIAVVSFIEPETHKKDTWIKSTQLPPDAIGDHGRTWGASIRVLCYAEGWGKRWGWYNRLAEKWSVDGVTSDRGIDVTWWMDVSDPMEIIKSAKS